MSGQGAQLGKLERHQLHLDVREPLLETGVIHQSLTAVFFFGGDLFDHTDRTLHVCDARNTRALMGKQCLGNRPALANLTHHILGGYAHIVEFHLIQAVMIVDRDDRVDLDPLALHIDQDEGDAFLLLARVIGAHQAEDPVSVLGIGRPDFGAVNNEVITISLGLGLEARKIRARTRFRVALTPPVFTLQDAGQEVLFLLIGAVGHDDVGHHHETKGHDIGDARQRTLGFVDVLLRGGPARAAVLGRPVGRDPALLVELALPVFDSGFVFGRAQTRLEFRCVGLVEKPANFVAKRQIFG